MTAKGAYMDMASHLFIDSHLAYADCTIGPKQDGFQGLIE